jgi:hypothetical protein
MQRRLFLWGIVMSWVAGAAGMASALTLDVDSFKPSCQLRFTQMDNLTWDGAGYPGGQRGAARPGADRAISGSSSIGAHHVRMQGLSNMDGWLTDSPFGPRGIAAVTLTGPPGGGQKVESLCGHTNLGTWLKGGVAVTGETAGSNSLIFPGAPDQSGMDCYPSLDHLGENERPWPIPGGGFWLLASGLLGVAGLSQKFLAGVCTSLKHIPGAVVCLTKNFIGGNRFNGVKAKSP